MYPTCIAECERTVQEIKANVLTPPMTPRPPAFVTAAASLGPAATFIPASRIGCLIFRRSVTVVLICSRRKKEPDVRLEFRG